MVPAFIFFETVVSTKKFVFLKLINEKGSQIGCDKGLRAPNRRWGLVIFHGYFILEWLCSAWGLQYMNLDVSDPATPRALLITMTSQCPINVCTFSARAKFQVLDVQYTKYFRCAWGCMQHCINWYVITLGKFVFTFQIKWHFKWALENFSLIPRFFLQLPFLKVYF